MRHSVNLESLNKKQLEAVLYTDGISLVIAGPGAGKTRVLTTKIAYLISEKGIKPENILALTFTNKAAGEMKTRISDILGIPVDNLYIGTFHSCFAKILRSNCEKLGYSKNFCIFDSTDSRNLVKIIVNNLGLDPEAYNQNTVAERISLMKSRLVLPNEYKKTDEYIEADQKRNIGKFYSVYSEYEKKCKEYNVMDFDDLLLNTYKLFLQNKKILSSYQNQFKYIFIDEFQDTNLLQYAIIKLLLGNNRNLCAVGDDSQSIYSFRGATISNILNFKKDFTDCKIFKLEQNYRSTKNIVEIANTIISNNKNKINKKIWTSNKSGEKCRIISAKNGIEEAKIIATIIKYSVKDGLYGLNDVAILYRMNFQSRLLESELRSKELKYKIVGSMSFYQHEEIKDILAFFRVIVNQNDSEAIRRTINRPRRGIGETTIIQVCKLAEKKKARLWDIMSRSNEEFSERISRLLSKYVTIVQPLIEKVKTSSAYELASELCETAGFLQYYGELKTDEGIQQYENIKELLKSIKDFTEDENISDHSLIGYMQNLQLDSDSVVKSDKDEGAVSLMTVHSVKGLEYKCVFVIGLEESTFPMLCNSTLDSIEEERRLFYVAVTRAEKFLYLSYASSRYLQGENRECSRSRFLDEIDENNIDPNLITGTQFKSSVINKKVNDNDNTSYSMFKYSIVSRKISDKNSVVQGDVKKGAEIYHSLYGKGRILNINGSEKNLIRASFDKFGEKTLIKDQCKLVVFSE